MARILSIFKITYHPVKTSLRRLQRTGQRVGMIRVEEDRRPSPIAKALDDRHQFLNADEAPFRFRHPDNDRKPMLPRGLDNAVQCDQIRHVKMTNSDPAGVGLSQYLE
jgi:hypothetical protein